MAVLGGVPAVLGGTFQATASGAIANGDPIKINSNGTVSKATAEAGLSMYVCGSGYDAIYQFSLGAPFDIATGVYHQSKSVANEENIPQGITFSANGGKFFVIGSGQYDIHEYTVGTGFDIATAKFIDSKYLASTDNAPRDVVFNNDGSKFFWAGDEGNQICEWACSTNYDISTSSATRTYSVVSSLGSGASPNGVTFNADGTKMFVSTDGTSSPNCGVHEFTLSTGFNLSSVSHVDGIDLFGITNTAKSVRFNTDGTRCFFLGDGPNQQKIYQLTLSTGFDISTASLTAFVTFNILDYINAADLFGLSFGDGVVGQSSYIGIANSAVSDGATATVQVIGAIDDAASGLTAGRTVYVSTTGTLTHTKTSLVAGVALTASKVLIKGAYAELFS